MDNQQKYKWAVAGLVVMVLLNAVTLGMLWFNTPDEYVRDRENRVHRDGIQRFMEKELKLSEAQADTIRTLRRKHFREAGALMRELSQTRSAYFDLMMETGNADRNKQDSLADSIASQYKEVEHLLYRHISEINDVLDKEQQPRFEQLMKDTFIRGHNRRAGQGEQRRRGRQR